MSAPPRSDRLARALARLLWNSIADQSSCACAPRDRCPLCEAMLALGLGRWKGWRVAQMSLAELALVRGWRFL
jgi:hypothetical protein